jgi:hypothetical protein
MQFLGPRGLVGIALLLALTGPAASQRVCQPDDSGCFNSRMHSQREQTLRRMQADEARRSDGTVRAQRDSNWEQFRREQIHRRSSPVCDVKPIISGAETRVVPTC